MKSSRKHEPPRQSVLVVDDEDLIRNLIVSTLRLEGYEVLEAGDGQEALDLADQARLDLVVLDVMMPGIDGFEVCRRLRAHPRHARVKIILLTAHAGAANVLRGHMVGADAYVAKPLGVAHLLAKIRALLGE